MPNAAEGRGVLCPMSNLGLLFLAIAQGSLAKAATGEDIMPPALVKSHAVKDGGRIVQVPDNMAYIPSGDYVVGVGGKIRVQGYAIGKYDVTNAEYKAFLVATHARNYPSYWQSGSYPEGKANHPVVYVSLTMARAYAAWVSKETGWKTAIPTSEQWEVAARGPNGYRFPWGDFSGVSYADGIVKSKFNFNGVTAAAYLKASPKREVTYDNPRSKYFGTKTTVDQIVSVGPSGMVRGWVDHQTNTGFIYTDLFTELNRQGGYTSAVGAYPDGKSAFGCYDMAGNVWNWCETEIVATNGAERGKTVNEIRGGSWYANLMSCSSTYRGEGRAAAGAYNTVGFRIVVLPQ